MFASLVLILLATAVAVPTVRLARADPRRLSIPVLGVVAIGLALAAIRPPSGSGPDALVTLLTLALVISPVLVLALVVFLVRNGLELLRREGRRLANALPLLAAVAIVAGGGLSLALLLLDRSHAGTAALGAFLLFALAWAGLELVVLSAYALVYPRIAGPGGDDYVIVHGSGLIRGQVPPLLAARVDAGIAAWRELRSRNSQAVLILSGGQGPDEPRSEASAMAEYAIEHGVDPDAVWREEASTTTQENLRLTRRLVEERLGSCAGGVAVTSNYHVLRTALLARRAGLAVAVRGARTADYYWPAAFQRELVAMVALHPWWNLLGFLLMTVPLPLAMILFN